MDIKYHSYMLMKKWMHAMIHHILIQVKKPLMMMKRDMRYVVVEGRASYLGLMTLLDYLFSQLA
jgi:hypothetical protein